MQLVLDFLVVNRYTYHLRKTMYGEYFYEIPDLTEEQIRCLIDAFPDADFREWRRSNKLWILWYP